MRFYLASRFARREELREYAAELMALGHTITARWLFGDHEGNESDNTPEQHALNQRYALEDLHDIYSCDVMITFGESPIDPPPGSGRGGRHAELGWALGMDKTIVLVGVPENLFYFHPNIIIVPDWAEAKARIDHLVIWRKTAMIPRAIRGVTPFYHSPNKVIEY